MHKQQIVHISIILSTAVLKRDIKEQSQQILWLTFIAIMRYSKSYLYNYTFMQAILRFSKIKNFLALKSRDFMKILIANYSQNSVLFTFIILWYKFQKKIQISLNVSSCTTGPRNQYPSDRTRLLYIY